VPVTTALYALSLHDALPIYQRVRDDAFPRDSPAPAEVRDQLARSPDLRLRVRLLAVVGESHPERVVVAVRPALPDTLACVPGPLLVGNELPHRPVPPHDVVVGHPGSRVCTPAHIARIATARRAVDHHQVRLRSGRPGVAVRR